MNTSRTQFESGNLRLHLLLLVTVCFGCESSGTQSKPGTLPSPSVDVASTSWALMEMIRAIAGNELTTQLFEPEAGLSWRNRRGFFPDDAQLALLAQAKLVVDNGPGVAYVNWFGMSAVAEDRVCNSSVNFRLDDYIPIKDYQSVHSHGPEGEHSHDYLVPYCWHDPSLAAKQVVAIQRSLTNKWPELESSFADRSTTFKSELATLAESLKSAGSGVSAETEVVLATPDLMFLARAMGMKARYELWFDEVDDAAWTKRIQSLRPSSGEIKTVVLLWPGTAPEIVRQAALDTITLVEIDMLESGSVEGTFLQRFEQLVDKLKRDLRKE